MKVLAIGERPLLKLGLMAELDIDVTAGWVGSQDAHVVRCRHPAELPGKLERLGARGRVTHLDIFDHGAEGMQMLGAGALFVSDAYPRSELGGIALARQLDPYLTEAAELRLLGRHTGEGAAGRQLLAKLGRALGRQRRVVGMYDRAAAAAGAAAGEPLVDLGEPAACVRASFA
jgi:hypothetical protein